NSDVERDQAVLQAVQINRIEDALPFIRRRQVILEPQRCSVRTGGEAQGRRRTDHPLDHPALSAAPPTPIYIGKTAFVARCDRHRFAIKPDLRQLNRAARRRCSRRPEGCQQHARADLFSLSVARSTQPPIAMRCTFQRGGSGGMDMRRSLGAIAALVTLLATPVLAADMALKAPPPAASPAGNWAGFYVGINGGGGWNDPTGDRYCV